MSNCVKGQLQPVLSAYLLSGTHSPFGYNSKSSQTVNALEKIGHFLSLHLRPCSLSCINEYLAIDSGGNVSDLALVRNCCLTRMLLGEAELVCRNEQLGLPGKTKSVKRFERSNGLDTALYKNYFF